MFARLPLDLRPTYGWVIVVVAALAMVATLPGRTHGLGMVTERLLADEAFPMDRVAYSDMNFWATLLGAAFCLPCGRLIDCFGLRVTLTATVVLLASVVLWMTSVSGKWPLFAAILLTRGLGQSALSVISITMVGKWYRGRLGLPMAIYSLLLSLGFVEAAKWAEPFAKVEWRLVWGGMGWILLLCMAPIAWLLTRDPPEEDQGAPPDSAAPGNCTPAIEGFTLRQALRTRAFWVFGLAICVVAVVTSGQSLFNESVLKLQDFPVQAFYDLMVLSGTVGMVVKLPVGWLARFLPLGRMQAAGLLMMAACLCWLPRIHEPWELTVYAVGMGVAGTITTVLFFMVWGQAFGRAHLGEIQGVAQMLTLVASACGPSLLSRCLEHTGSYALVFQVQAAAAAVLAAASWRVWVPRPDDAPRLQEAGSVRAMPETALSIE